MSRGERRLMHATQPDWERARNIIRSAQVRDRIGTLPATSQSPVWSLQNALDRYRLVVTPECIQNPGLNIVPVIVDRRLAIRADPRVQHRERGGRSNLLGH